MKTVIDYLKEHGKYVHNFKGRAFEIVLHKDKVMLGCESEWIAIDAEQDGYVIENEITELLEDKHIEIRFCEECGKPFDAGFIAGDGDWYCCEDCFDVSMNETYGVGKWRPSEEEGVAGGWYEHLDGNEWLDTGVYYTEWY